MADMKISDLTAAGAASGAMQLEVNDSGTSKRVTVDQLKAYVIPAGSITATELATGSVGSDEIIDGAVGTLELTDGGVTTAKLASGSVTTLKIVDANVTTAKIADGNVTGIKLEASGVTAGSYGSSSSIPTITVDAKGRVTGVSTNAVTPSIVSKYVVTDSADYSLAAGGGAGNTNVGASFSMKIPVDGIIQGLSWTLAGLGNTTAAAHIICFGLRIGTTNYWFNTTSGNNQQFSIGTTSNASKSFSYIAESSIIDVTKQGLPTGVQTVQLIAGYITTLTTLKGTTLQTRVVLQVTG